MTADNIEGFADAGVALGDKIRQRVRASAALAVIVTEGSTLTDYARGGMVLEALWIAAEESGLGVHPVSPVFLCANNDNDTLTLSTPYADQLRALRRNFRTLVGGTTRHPPCILQRGVPAHRFGGQRHPRRLDGIGPAAV
ncbi:MAG: hypothetical protein ACLQIK_23210 [Mycobacterium sp.]|uniref:hypothetical protein n=1 Tax=Mycobacterium sp. TaxID=1785 RepID=UPI003F9B8D12